MNILNRKPAITDQPKPFNINELEADIAQELGKDRKSEMEQLVEYAPHPTEQVARLTSLAVMQQHEQAAEAIKRLAETVNELSGEHERSLQELDAMGKLIVEAAEKYMALGRERSELIARSRQDHGRRQADLRRRHDEDRWR